MLKCIKFDIKVYTHTLSKLHRMLFCSVMEYVYKLRNGCTEIESDHQSIEPVQYEGNKEDVTWTAMKRTTVSIVPRNWLRDMTITRVTQNSSHKLRQTSDLLLHKFVEGRITF